MTEQQLREIEERAGKHRQSDDYEDWMSLLEHANKDIPALVAEVRRLRGVLASIADVSHGIPNIPAKDIGEGLNDIRKATLPYWRHGVQK